MVRSASADLTGLTDSFRLQRVFIRIEICGASSEKGERIEVVWLVSRAGIVPEGRG